MSNDVNHSPTETDNVVPFTDPFSDLTFKTNNNNETVANKNNKSNSSSRSASPVPSSATQITDSNDYDLNQLAKRLNDDNFTLPQLSLQEENEEETSGNDDATEGDDMDSYFKNASSIAVTNTGDISLNLNLTNTEEILPTLNEIAGEDYTIESNLLNQFDIALRSGQNYNQIKIESIDTQFEEQQEETVHEEDNNNNAEMTTTTTTNTNIVNNSTISADETSIVSLLYYNHYFFSPKSKIKTLL